MNTKEYIIQTADNLIREKGYNAFSFIDIATVVGIKKPSIHHHFPHKADLGVAVIEWHLEKLNHVMETFKDKKPVEQLDKFLSIYSDIRCQNKVCLVGSLSTDYNTLEPEVQHKLKAFSDTMLDWVSHFLKAGRNNKEFDFKEEPRTKALLIISNMIAIVQLVRVTNDADFNIVTEAIKQELLIK